MRLSLVALLTAFTGVATAQNLYIAGTTYSGSQDFYETATAVKGDGAGNIYLLFAKRYGDNSRVIKYGPTGSVIWSTAMPADAYANAMALDASGDPVVVGRSNGKLLIVKIDTLSGASTVFLKENPYNPARGVVGTAVAIDPADDTIVVGGIIDRGSDPESTARPLVAKYSNDGASQIWISAPTNVRAQLSKLIVDKNRVYFGGTTYADSSVYVGYIPTNGGTPQSVTPTAAGAYRRSFVDMVVADDRLVWTGREYDWGGPDGWRLHWGQVDYSATGGGGSSVFTEPDFSYRTFGGIAYDPGTGVIAIQQNGWNSPNTVQFEKIDPTTDGFTHLGSCEVKGGSIGIVSLGKGYFGSLNVETFGIGEAYWANVVNSTAGYISGTPFKGVNTTYSVTGPSLAGNQIVFARGTRVGASTTRFQFAPGPTNDVIRMDEDATFKGNILRNDIGVGTKTLGGYTPPAHAATFTLSETGNLVYKPEPNWYGTDTFTYDQYIDGAFYRKRTVTVTVKNTNDAPTAVNDAIGSIDGTGTVIVDALANDLNPDGALHPLKYLSVTQPSNGTASLADGKTVLKIKAKPGAAGQSFSFTYTVQNGTGKTSSATVTGTFAP